MQQYETLCILRPDLEEEMLEDSIEKVRSVIQDAGGEVHELQRWGKKRLASLVEEYQDGYYILLTFTANQEALENLKHLFKVNEPYLRYMTVRLDEKEEEQKEEVQEEDQGEDRGEDVEPVEAGPPGAPEEDKSEIKEEIKEGEADVE